MKTKKENALRVKRLMAIAEAMGWTNLSKSRHSWGAPSGIDPNVDGVRCDVPDYFHDLNATHEVEAFIVKKLSRALRYEEILVTVCQNTHPPGTEMGSLWHATAEQKAEAILKTLGKWEDDK